MRYTVIWKPAAIQELATLWTNASDRERVRISADSFDHDVALQPLELGESSPGGFRVAFADVLGFVFHVDESDRLVSVVRVWRIAAA